MSETAPDLIKGINNICSYIGESRNDFHHLVAVEKLPVWQRTKDGTWRALRPRLNNWLVLQADKHKPEEATQESCQ